MRILLDTHVLLWWLAGATIEAGARKAIASSGADVYVSAASMWEVAIKRASGKLKVPAGFETRVARDFGSLPMTAEHAWLAGGLPRHHDDPFDRMLVAQATVEQMGIVTRDPRFAAYGIPLINA